MAEGMEKDMANEESLQLSFPLPPVTYYKKFTSASVSGGIAPKPPAVIQGVYSLFGDNFDTNDDIIRPLESQGIPRLYSNNENCDILVEMKKINHSILIKFLELMDVLIDSPLHEEKEKALEDINVLFINLHHLINEFRPHQARETLRVMLNRQKSQRIETAEKLQKHIEKAKAVLCACQSNLANKSSLPWKLQMTNYTTLQDTKLSTEEPKNCASNDLETLCEIVDKFS